MKIEVFGKGCSKCLTLEKHCREALKELGISADVIHVFDLEEIVKRGVFVTPALVIDGKTMIKGHVGTVGDVKEAIARSLNSKNSGV